MDMPDFKMILKYYFHVLLIVIITLCSCDCTSSEVKSNVQNKNDVTSDDSKYEVAKMHEASKNGSVNENDLKDTVQILSSKVNTSTATTVMEGFTIFAFLSIALVLYFTIKSIRLRRRRSRVRKYGLLTNRDDVVEMTPLGDEDEDEDSTVFDINDHPQP